MVRVYIDSQTTKCKDKHQGALLVNGQLARPDGLHGQQQDQDVGGNGVAGVGVPVLGQTDTRRLGGLVPGAADGLALPDGHGGAGDGVGGDDAQEDVAADAEPLLDKDAQIQEHNGHFGQVDGELVEDLGDVEPLDMCEPPIANQHFEVIVAP